MKRSLLYAVALIALASCTSDEYVGGGNSPDTPDVSEAAVVFGSGVKTVTRADHVGADAATLLNNKFYVVSFNGNGATMSQTFDNYLVEWTSNTAGTTQSNTSDWEYVGKTAPAWSGISGNTQTIKFWDYSKDQYDFIAWSPGTATVVTSGVPSAGEVKISKPAMNSPYSPTYQLEGARDDLAKCFIADMVTAYKEDKTPAQPKFQREVSLTFRNLASKVRVALYENVPGYSVKDIKFYTDASTPIATGATETNATLFTTGTTNDDKFFSNGCYTVNFPNIGNEKLSDSDYNKAHVSFTPSSTGMSTTENFGALNLAGKENNEADATNYLGRTLPTTSYAGTASPYYKTMLPNEVGTVLNLRVDYTLLATDGSGEEIKIHGATAYVPQVYAKWKPNYAYTYVFKITDNTNGWTSTINTDPAGLYPITFDAVVVDSEERTQSTITTVSTPSITTYQKGHDLSKDEYLASTGDIYLMVMDNGTPKTDIGTKGYLYSVTGTPVVEANVMDALNIVETLSGGTESPAASSITGRNGLALTRVSMSIALTIPDANGSDITVDPANSALKFTPESGKTYAFVYVVRDEADCFIYSAEALTSQPSDWSTAGVWYQDPNGVTSVGTYADGTYYKKYTNLNKVYAVKVIKVQ